MGAHIVTIFTSFHTLRDSRHMLITLWDQKPCISNTEIIFSVLVLLNWILTHIYFSGIRLLKTVTQGGNPQQSSLSQALCLCLLKYTRPLSDLWTWKTSLTFKHTFFIDTLLWCFLHQETAGGQTLIHISFSFLGQDTCARNSVSPSFRKRMNSVSCTSATSGSSLVPIWQAVARTRALATVATQHSRGFGVEERLLEGAIAVQS